MIAFIPARGGSKRVPRKNIRTLGHAPAIAHVIQNLKAASGIKAVCVSSEDEEILTIAKAAGAEVLTPRDARLSQDSTSIVELLREDLPRFIRHFGDSDVLLTMPTSVLVTSEYYSQAIEQFNSQKGGLVIAVTAYEVSAYLAVAEGEGGSVVPLHPEYYLKPTVELPKTYYDSGAFYLINHREFNSNRSLKTLFDLSPVGKVVLPSHVGIDVDTEQDWKRLETAFLGGVQCK